MLVMSLGFLPSFGLGRENTLTKRPKKANIKVDETFIVLSCGMYTVFPVLMR